MIISEVDNLIFTFLPITCEVSENFFYFPILSGSETITIPNGDLRQQNIGEGSKIITNLESGLEQL